MTEIEPTREQIEAFKAAWHEAYEKGMACHRVEAGLRAVLNMPKPSTPGVAEFTMKVVDVGAKTSYRLFALHVPSGKVFATGYREEELIRNAMPVPEPRPEPDPLEGHDHLIDREGDYLERLDNGMWQYGQSGVERSSAEVIERWGPVRPVILGDPIGVPE